MDVEKEIDRIFAGIANAEERRVVVYRTPRGRLGVCDADTAKGDRICKDHTDLMIGIYEGNVKREYIRDDLDYCF